MTDLFGALPDATADAVIEKLGRWIRKLQAAGRVAS